MQIHLQRRSNDQHHLSVVRADGSTDAALLESKSMLVHDLVHYALEAELGLTDGFWGTVAAGRSFAELRAVPFGDSPGLARAERLVGPMQAVFHGRLDPAQYARMVDGDGPSEAAVHAVLERMRRLWGHWRATPFHETLALPWPPPDCARTASTVRPR